MVLLAFAVNYGITTVAMN